MIRPACAPSQRHCGYEISAHLLQPDVLIRINGADFGIYLSTSSGYKAAMKHIDETLKEWQS